MSTRSLPALFTIVSANYIAFAATLMQSVRRFHPDMPRYIVLADAPQAFDGLDLAAELIACDDLGIALLGNMKLWYSVIEFNTAIKPFTFQHLFDRHGFGAAIYLDPDIELYAPLDHVLAGLEGHSLVLTPHMTRPLQDGKHPSDLSIMKSGVYNLGFVALRNDEEGRGLVRWWCDRLFAHCRVDVPGNIFTDQRWMDLAPAFVERTLLLRHPGYNLAYWNLMHRTVTRSDDGGWRVDGRRLAFFHFSGLDPEYAASFSRHQNRFTMQTLGVVAELCAGYRDRVLANGWRTFRLIPYGFARFGDGKPILDPMRHWLLAAGDDGLIARNEPLEIDAAFFDVADETRFPGGARLTRYMHQLWRDRPDLNAAFDLGGRAGVDTYVAWICDGAAANEGIDAALIEAVRTLRDQPAAQPSAPPLPQPATPPWPSMAVTCWPGPARDAAQWLTGTLRFTLGGVELGIQRQAALLWELRADLQQYFPIGDGQGLQDYQLWTLTDGMREGAIVAGLFTAEDLALFAPASGRPGEPPVTPAMILTARSEHARDGLQVWRQFPETLAARTEQAFWYAFLAPRALTWPDSLVAPLRAYFAGPSGLAADGYALSRGTVALHAMRDDIQDSFSLDDEAGRWRYLGWVLLQGAREYGLDVGQLCPGIGAFLATPSPRYPLLTRLAEFAYDQRDDLKSAFNLNTRVGLGGMQAWLRTELEPWLAGFGLQGLLAAPTDHAPGPVVPPPHRCFVVLVGDWTSPSGIGEDIRTAVASLDAVGFADYVIVDLVAGQVITAGRAVLPAGQPVEAAWAVMFHNADTALADWRTLRRLGVAAGRVAAHWLWELERMPARWTHAFSFCDEVWASTQFVRQIFEPEARRPVRLLHHAIAAPRPSGTVLPGDLGVPPDTTVFLFMFDVASYVARKNPGAVIRAFLEAFPSGDERACLLIKAQNAELRPDLWAGLAGMTSDPRVVLKDARMSRDEVTTLVASASAFVSLHRSEGFGRGPAEAMLLGVPVIITGYSGTADFADETCACIVGYTLVPVQPGEYPGVEGQRWAEPDVSQAAGFMRWVHAEPAAAQAIGRRGQARVAPMLAPAKIGADMLALLRSPAVA